MAPATTWVDGDIIHGAGTVGEGASVCYGALQHFTRVG